MRWYNGVEGAIEPFDYPEWRYRQLQKGPQGAGCTHDGHSANAAWSASSAMGAAATADEYSVVVRVFSDVRVPNGYKHVDAADALFLVQYAREMTLARGCVLYEVWVRLVGLVDFGRQIQMLTTPLQDRWTNSFMAYIVPTAIFSEAISYRSTFDGWGRLGFHDRTVRQHAHTLILDSFPRIVPVAAKIIAEKMIGEKRQVTSRNVEQNVVNHIRHCWTSYELRFTHKDHEGKYTSKSVILDAIKPRMRMMLQKWLPAATDHTKLAVLWRRHHLLDNAKGRGSCREDDIFRTPTALTWFGGKETAANLGKFERVDF